MVQPMYFIKDQKIMSSWEIGMQSMGIKMELLPMTPK